MASNILQPDQLPRLGDHLWIHKKGYSHHALFVGLTQEEHPMVIHYAGWVDGFRSGPLCLETLDRFSQGKTVHVRQYRNRLYSREESVERALQRLGEDQYNVHDNNCEHFCAWAIMGEHNSKQVDWFNTALGAIHPGLEAASKGVSGLKHPSGMSSRARKQVIGAIAKDLAIDWGLKSAARWVAGPVGVAAYVGYRVSKQILQHRKH
ncbi:lecithin retinol acyltransferase family protein [Reinekea marina]|uniref:Lecithin retinol acyltransferase family protein n=1 Tax=Reinekea marina TaxID=1310421 RepID=A0ABV7WP06_9GAMM|nr:lecithin retinol acyltransferase family protein [Reinekea marina]MDN3647731.1 lecithin retinol acyltransferase family protein [Reinekea marina]